MTENSEGQGGKKDWSHVESLLNAHDPPPTPTPGQLVQTRHPALVPAENSEVPAPLVVPAPDLASQGILARFKANQLGRKAALEQLQVQYNGQLELLKETV